MAAPALELAAPPAPRAAADRGRGAPADPADHRGHVPVRARRRQLVVRPAACAGSTSSTGPCCRSSRRTAARRCTSCRAHAREAGPIEVWSEQLPRGRRAARPRAGAARRARARAAGLERRHRTRCSTSGCGAGATRRACGARSAPAAAGRRSSTGWRDVLGERVPEAGTPPAAGPRRGRDALPDALLGRPHGGRADAAGRRAARDRRRAGRRSPRSCTRRCTARRWC